MKKVIFSTALVVSLVALSGCGDVKTDTPEKEIVEETTAEKSKGTEKKEVSNEVEKDTDQEVEEEVTPEDAEVTKDEVIKQLTEQIVEEDLDNTTFNKLQVNEHMGKNDGTYIVLPHLKWDVKNRAKTTQEMLEMYSDHLAAKLAENKDVSEITVFWEVPYHLEGDNVAKFMYERSGDGMAKTDIWLAPLLQ